LTAGLPIPDFELADRVSKRQWLEELQSSPSWRVTAPLRKLKQAVGK
jgi:hypothetical protein